ncbi:MAG: tyrosine recombinase XerC [Lactobacillales bacterium]|jgi:integrase/recombinase XerC|nr:tyrosine recombinase XerC [Lactobacillales bacterium]
MPQQYKSLSTTISTKLNKTIASWQNDLLTLRRLSKHTADSYLTDMKEFMDFLAGHMEKEIDTGDLKKLSITDFRSFLVWRSSQNAARASIARSLSTLRNFFKYLSREGILENTAIMSVRSARLSKVLPKPLSQTDARAFLAAVKEVAKDKFQEKRDAALYTLLYGCGLRINEALSLNVDNFPLDGGAFTVMGKGGKERLVPLLPIVKSGIKEYLKYHPNPAPLEPLFVGSRGERLNPGVVQRNVRFLRRYLNLPDTVTPHALRHSFATHILQGGGDLRTVQELLGHASLSATQRYTEIDMAHLDKVYAAAHPRAQKKS